MEYSIKIVAANAITQEQKFTVKNYSDLNRMAAQIRGLVRDTVKVFPAAREWEVKSISLRPEGKHKSRRPAAPKPQLARAAAAS
jgi:hypothetical protein